MITLLYRARTVGPVCQRLARLAPDTIQAIRDDQEIPNDTTVVRWGSVLPWSLGPQLNLFQSVSVAQDHVETRKRLGALAPETFFQKSDLPAPGDTGLVIRPEKHQAGKRFYVCHTPAQVNQAIRLCGQSWYASTLIEKKKEYRVFVCQGRIVAVSERFHADNAVGKSLIAWNLALGGRLINVRYKSWPITVCKAAILAAERLDLDWCAIDACIDVSNNVFVFEANTAPGLRNPFTMGKIVETLMYIDDHGIDRPLPTRPAKTVKKDSWKALIHPALW